MRLEFPALRSLETTPNNLPLQPTTFIGRDKELAELKRLFATARLLTLTGAGGCGKTRLGLQLAADSLDRFPDGAWLVELAPLSDPGLVPRTVAMVLGLEERPGKAITATLVEHLKDKRLLMVFDNCEHLLGACAELADFLVRRCPHLTILASSREALGIAGEQTYRVPSLSLPEPKEIHTPASIAPYEALRLFVDRCLGCRPDFRVTRENAATLVSICHRLDGIPLAIELAAARVRSLSVEEINRRLDHLFRLLTGGSRTALPRQQTLRSLIDWSYDLLHDSERLLLQHLSVFAGGWTLEAAERICAGDHVEDGEVLDRLTSLIDKSLVAIEEGDGRFRYRLLETVRQYARERLVESGGAEAIRDRHRDYFVALAEDADKNCSVRSKPTGCNVLKRSTTICAWRSSGAWRGSSAGRSPTLRAMHRFWFTRGYVGEGRNGVRGSSPKANLRSPPWSMRTRSMSPAASPGIRPIFPPRGHCSSKALRFRRRSMTAAALHVRSTPLETWRSSKATIRRHKRLSGEPRLSRELGDRRGAAALLGNLAMVAHECGDLVAARTLSQESLALSREVGDQGRVAHALNMLGSVACDQGDLATARALNQEGLAIGRELGDLDCIATSLSNLGVVAVLRGEFGDARLLYSEGIAIRREMGDRVWLARALEGAAALAAAQGDSLTAARTWGAAERLREEQGRQSRPTSGRAMIDTRRWPARPLPMKLRST